MSEVTEKVQDTEISEERTEVCFWCGSPKDMKRDKIDKGEKCIVRDYEMCSRCREKFKEGIRLMGVTEEPVVKGMFPIIQEGDITLYPTGSIMQCHEDYVKDILEDDPERLNTVLEHKMMFMPENILEKLIKKVREMDKEIDQT